MSLKNVNDLVVGMVLAADVTNLDGQILFKKGLALSERHLEILEMWGIPNVEIESEDEDEEPLELERFPPQIIVAAERQVAPRFKLVKSSHPAVDILRSICVLETAKALKSKQEKSHAS